jgi:hypothetical protein
VKRPNAALLAAGLGALALLAGLVALLIYRLGFGVLP